MPLLPRQPPLLQQSIRAISRPRTPLSRRTLSNSSPPPSPPKKDPRSQLRRLNDRLPAFLRAYTTPLLGAPATHITSFLILHELTAIVPLFGLVAAFHYGDWLPDLTANRSFEEGTQRFARWLRKKGWVEDADVESVVGEGTSGDATGLSPTRDAGGGAKERTGAWLILEFATAYAITKAFLPLRIAASFWATPWFARVVVSPLARGTRALFGRK
ncbi:hypothetical protein BDW42DRAFT_116810 [Aspergillus taichungensis]|uniref:Uncharacterized protein n=1 Tax=Aspergillus taichungensis TaxID=482145 RepID=A0A2J5HSC0_9EURO|nr:hypothetical protein BDW42DRAFT_116810 [Aspergillus taichungensis]